jgi:serine/threonine protein kinase
MDGTCSELLKLHPEKITQVVTFLINAIRKLHDMNIVHLDIKFDNVLYRKNGDSEIFKLADFGLSRQMSCPPRTMTK